MGYPRRSDRIRGQGVVLGLVGAFLVQAALRTLAGQPFGPYVLGTVALGLVAFGAFMSVVARRRRIEPA